jgi:hypothetical protein
MQDTQTKLDWIDKVKNFAQEFANEHKLLLATTDRQLSAAFEIGTLHALLRFYRTQGYDLTPTNLTSDGEYRYLTSPAGNPANYSYVLASGADGEFEIRQQVRVRSHVDPDIAFTPDILVLLKDTTIASQKSSQYAAGKRSFYSVDSSSVVAAHECKSMNPFPELMVSFIGMLVSAHEWYPNGQQVTHTQQDGHLAPTLFVGGSARGLHLKMITAMQSSYKLNIVCGLHEGTWNLTEARNRLLLGQKATPQSTVI